MPIKEKLFIGTSLWLMEEVIQLKLKISVSKNTEILWKIEILLQIVGYNIEGIESDLLCRRLKYGIDIEIKICQLR